MPATPGPKPKPHNVHKLHNPPKALAKERAAAKQGKTLPQLPVKTPDRPANLSDDAARAWTRMVNLIEPMKVFATVDGGALERMCETYALVRKLQDEVAEHGVTYWSDGPSGRLLKMNPAVAALRAADTLLKGYFIEFGMTPSARVRVHSGEGGDGPQGEDGEDLLD